jgi:tetrapyrrole methylase family protein/MazG family protein
MNFYELCDLPVFMHCHAGLGRSGTFAAIYLLTKGYSAGMAISSVRDCRPGAIETKQQEMFIEQAEKILPALDDYQDATFFNAKKIVEVLRRKCPWDREQTHESLIESLLDESFEVVEAIREKNPDHLREEVGDLLLQPLIQAQVSEDSNQFTIYESIDELIRKLITRHPHVFSKNSSLTADGVVNQWNKIKITEKNNKMYSPVNDIIAISEEAADYGFDWETPFDILRKVEEEVKEVEEAIKNSHSRKIEQEIGDLLFAVFNITRYMKIDPIKSLEKGRRKFEQRFRYLQTLLKQDKKDPKKMTSRELDIYWNRVKSVLSVTEEK